MATAPQAADLLGTPLTPEQQAAAAAQANGGVPAFGGAPSDADTTVPLVDPGQGEPSAASGSQAARSDGAVLVESPSSAAQNETTEQTQQAGQAQPDVGGGAGEESRAEPRTAGEGAAGEGQEPAQTQTDAQGASQPPAGDSADQSQADDGAVKVGGGQ